MRTPASASPPSSHLLEGWMPLARVTEARSRDVYQLRDESLLLLHEVGAAASPWRVLPDRCLHRGRSLSRGRVLQNGSVECSAHGWAYDHHHGLWRVPGMHRPPPTLDSAFWIPWDVREAGGFLWVAPRGLPTAPPPTSDLFEGMLAPVDAHAIVWRRIRDLPVDTTDLLENALHPLRTTFEDDIVIDAVRSALGIPSRSIPAHWVMDPHRLQQSFEWSTPRGDVRVSQLVALPSTVLTQVEAVGQRFSVLVTHAPRPNGRSDVWIGAHATSTRLLSWLVQALLAYDLWRFVNTYEPSTHESDVNGPLDGFPQRVRNEWLLRTYR